MRLLAVILIVGTVLMSSTICCAGTPPPQNCLSVLEAGRHVGKSRCVSGTVVKVEEGNNGVTFLDFCADYRSCPFTVIVFRGDLKNVGDVRQLQGRVVSIKGTIEEYDDRAEIILRHPQQLGESAALLTAIPKDYDVERQGHYSAGSPRLPKAKKTKHTRQGPPVSIEDPEEP
jgi:DNA/RNA endonuclease YhcR with UshA esterase domain